MAFDLRAKHEALKLQRLQSKSKASFELWLERFREPSRHQYVAQKKLWEECVAFKAFFPTNRLIRQ